MNYYSILGSAESNASDFVPTKLRRETTMLKKLPTIPQGELNVLLIIIKKKVINIEHEYKDVFP
jgi:hypothetical protein